MKKYIAIILSVMICMSVMGCGKEEGDTAPSENIEKKAENQTENSGCYEAVYLKDQSYQKIGYAVLENGTTQKLSERQIYGYPELTDDKKHVIYRHTYADSKTKEYIEALFSIKPSGNEVKLIDNPNDYKIGNNFAVVSTDDGVWYINDLDKPKSKKIGESVGRVEFKSTLAVNDKEKCTAFVTEAGELNYVDLKNDKTTVIASGVQYILKRIAPNLVCYVCEDGLYKWNGSEVEIIAPKDTFQSINNDDSIFRIGEKYYYISLTGELVDISDIGSVGEIVLSDNEKYLACMSYSNSLTVCELGKDGIKNPKVLEGDFTDAKIFDDGTAIASTGGSEQTVGIIKNGVFNKIADKFIYVKESGYYDGKIYYVDEALMECSADGKTNAICENTIVKLIMSNGTPYHIAKDSDGNKTLHGKDCTVIDKNVEYLF